MFVFRSTQYLKLTQARNQEEFFGFLAILARSAAQTFEKARFVEGNNLDFPSPCFGFLSPGLGFSFPAAWIFVPRTSISFPDACRRSTGRTNRDGAPQSADDNRRMTNSIRSSESSRQDFDLGHIGRLRVAVEPFSRLRARFAARQAKGLPPPGPICRGARARAPSVGDASGEIDRLFGPNRHRGPLNRRG